MKKSRRMAAAAALFVTMIAVSCSHSSATGGTGGAGGAGGAGGHMDMCGMPYDPDPRDATMTGELVHVVTTKGATPAKDQYEVLLPKEMQTWLYEQNWVQEHGDWHNIRRWDQGCPPGGGTCQSTDILTERGLWRAPIQEGEAGDGYAFLVMHRHMIRGFKEAFPKHADIVRGFEHVPLSQADPENPIPWVQVHWTDTQIAAINLLQDIEHNLDKFTSEDDLGHWIQLGSGMMGFPGFDGGPPPGFDGGFPDPDAGFPGGPPGGGGGGGGGVQLDSAGRPDVSIHGGLHGQWAVPSSPNNLANNNVNIPVLAFWRLHGWIDDMWERYRVAKGIGEDDPTYKAEMLAQCEEMHKLGMAKPMTSGTGPTETGVFAETVAPILTSYCSGCHDVVGASKGLVLTGEAPSKIRQGLVSVKATEVDMPLVDPSTPDNSWIMRKLTGDFTGIQCNGCNTAMPLAGAKPTAAQIDAIRSWIAAGATAN